MQYWVDYLCQALIIGAFVVSLNVILGSAGQLVLAPAAFGEVGGFVGAHFGSAYHWPFLPSLAMGAGFAVGAGFLVGLPALHLAPHHLIMLTLAFSLVGVEIFGALPFLGTFFHTGAIPHVSFVGVLLQPTQLLRLVLPICAVCFIVCWRLSSSPFGRVLRGIRENEEATQTVGKNTTAFKMTTFMITAGIMGIAGVTLVYFDGIGSPGLFTFNWTILMVAAVIVGGTGNVFGAFVGALLLVFLTPVLEVVVNITPTIAGYLQLMIFGVLLVVFLRVRPAGLVPEGFSFLPRHRFAGGPDVAAVPEAMQLGNGRPRRAGPASAAVGDGRDGSAVPVVVAQDLAKYFGGIRAVDGLSLRLDEGTVTALVGPNGAGKTTVFNLLTGRLALDRGKVFLRGRDITGMPPWTVTDLGMARTYQDVRTLRQLSCLDNVVLGVPGQPGEHLAPLLFRPRAVARGEREARERAMECLRFVGLQDLAATRGADLSYGDQKLLAVARVLATGADIILADEPASGIDRGSLGPVLELFGRLRDDGKTICLVEHNLDVVDQLADHVLFMEQGRVGAEGTMEEIKADPRLEDVYFGRVVHA